MACKDFEELILRDLDGEITNPDRIKLRDHLGGCSSCAKDREAFGKVDELIKKAATPAPPRRDYASVALEKAEAALVGAPRTVRKRMSDKVWAAAGLVGAAIIIGTIGAIVFFASQPVEITTPSLNANPIMEPLPEVKVTPVVTPTRTTPTVVTLGVDELRKIFPFGEKDPVGILADVNVQLAAADTSQKKIAQLDRGVEALLDGYADALANKEDASAKDYSDGLTALLSDGMIRVLGEMKDAPPEGFLRALGDAYSERSNALGRFALELSLERRFAVQGIVGQCNKVRDSARRAARQ